MAFYYIRNNGVFVGAGTGTTSSATKRVGAWDADPANSFASIEDYLASSPPTGSIAILADDHNHSYSVATTNKLAPVIGDFEYYSVDTLNQEQYKAGAKESVASGLFKLGADVFNGRFFIAGVSFESVNGDLTIAVYPAVCSFTDADITVSGLFTLPKGSTTSFNNCNISALYLVSSTNPSICEFRGGMLSVSLTSQPLMRYCGVVRMYDIDLSGCYNGLALVSGTDFQQQGSLELHRCKMPVSWVLQKPEATYPDTLEVSGTSCDNGDGYYYFFKKDAAYGEVISSSSVYLNYSYDGVSNTSALIATNSKVNLAHKNKWKLCEIPAQNLSATDTTYRVQLLLDTGTVASLSNADFWVELSHNDNTVLALGKIVSSRNTDILSVGTELTTSAETWQGTLPVAYKTYQVDITLSAAQLTNVTNGNVVVYVNLAVPNADVYVCPAVQIGT